MIDPYEYIRRLEEELGTTALSEWIKEAEKDDNHEARIIAHNILLDIKYGNISEEFKENITKRLIIHLDEVKKKNPEKDLLEQIKCFTDAKNHELGNEVFCCGNGVSVADKPEGRRIKFRRMKLGRIIKWLSIFKRLNPPGDEYVDGWVPSNKAELNQVLHEWYEQGRLPPFRGKAPLFWIFKKNEFEECQNEEGKCNVDSMCTRQSSCNVDFICKRLGIVCEKGADIIQIDFPSDSIQGDFQTPTVFDSLFILPFRSIFGKWGKTVNTETVKDEVDEAIHGEHHWPEGFVATRFGKISQGIEFSEEKKELLWKKLKEEAGEVPNYF